MHMPMFTVVALDVLLAMYLSYIYIEQIDNGLNCFRSLRSNIIAT